MHKGLEDKLVKEYYKYQVDIAVIFGADRTVAEKDMLDVVNFEINMANVSSGVQSPSLEQGFQGLYLRNRYSISIL